MSALSVSKPLQHYGRMFPPAAQPIGREQEKALIALGRSMRAAALKEGTFTTRAGFTYFGQFVDHDLTHDRTALDDRAVDPARLLNYRSPFLDLDLVYGEGPRGCRELYEGERGGERFRIGRTAPADVAAPCPGDSASSLSGGTLRDVPRDAHGAAVLADKADPRNLENAIVLQIHVLLMQFHNVTVDQCDRIPSKHIAAGATRFERARQLVRWHYQRLVHQQFLSEILDPRILYETQHSDRLMEWHERAGEVPIEFSHAAFRFGHSMVRSFYNVNRHRLHFSLPDLMRRRHATETLPEDWLFEWGRIFPWLPRTGDQVTPSAPITTAIAPALHHLPPDHTRLPSSETGRAEYHPELPVRTLLRGARARVPSGQEVAQALIKRGLLKKADALTADELVTSVAMTNDASGSVLKANGLETNTPLFYYILKEAEVQKKGRRLGAVGSRLVAEVFESLLRRDESSYLRRFGLSWDLPEWEFPDGKTGLVDSLSQLIRLVGDPLPQGCRV